MNKKIVSIALVFTVVAISAITTNYFSSTVSSGPVGETLGYTGIACTQVIRANGKLEDLGCQHNLITNIGKEYIKAALNSTASMWNFTNLTLGGNTTTMAVGDTDLANIFSASTNLSAGSAAYWYIGVGNSSLSREWTANATAIVNSTGIYNTTNSAAKLFAEAYFGSSTTLASGDKINVTYYWWIA